MAETNISYSNVRFNKRDKRHEHNIVVENASIEDNYPRWIDNGHLIQDNDKNKKREYNLYGISRSFHHNEIEKHHAERIPKNRLSSKSDEVNHKNHFRRSDTWSSYPNKQDHTKAGNTKPRDWFLADKRQSNSEHSTKGAYRKDMEYASSEKEFDMYEIGNPDLLYTVQVQLFEKLTTPEGKTVWNDMTKGEPAR